jgi:hypothetical protein
MLSAVLAVMMARTNGSWLGVPKAWITGMLAALARPIIRAELVGVDSGVDSGVGGAREIAATMRIGRFRTTKWRIPAGIIRSVRWEPDSGSAIEAPRDEWLVLLDIREEVPPELARFKQDATRTMERFGLRAAAMAIARTREGAERDGLRLIAFLESCGLRLEPDPKPELEDPSLEQRIAPPTSPEGIDATMLKPERAAAAKHRVRWVVVARCETATA